MGAEGKFITCDGNEAAAEIAFKTNEVVAIYPITPASPMGEWSDAWAAMGKKNLDGIVPKVIELQSEGGAAGTVHGALQAGALSTTFTASQGLLLMIPNMFKIAGELTPTVFHVAARTIATHALSIFGDHSDVMTVRSCGWAMLAATSVQEAHDFALISQIATLRSRVPFVHFFDGFRTSHEVNKIERIPDDVIRALWPMDDVAAHRQRALDPDRPVLRGSAQNPDIFFQAREAANPFYLATPDIVQDAMDRFAGLTGRQYRAFDYYGAPDAERVVVLMGSGAGAAYEAIDALNRAGERVGMIIVRLYRPFDADRFMATLPATTRAIAVLDRTKEPGAAGEPLYQDVAATLYRHWPIVNSQAALPRVIHGRYGLSSKEFTPAMVARILDELQESSPKPEFTIGIVDDVTNLSLSYDADRVSESDQVTRAVFYGLGSDGTVGATKNSAKIIGENTPLHVQGYFVYDSKKSGAITVSHLRFSPQPIQSTYLIQKANFVACHQFQFVDRLDMLELATPGATFLLNSPFSADEVWQQFPVAMQQQLIEKKLKLYVVDAAKVASDAGLAGRINTVMQTCFFALSGILPRDEAIEHIKTAIRKTYSKRGEAVVERNFAAVDGALAALVEVPLPANVVETVQAAASPIPETTDDFINRITKLLIAGKGELLPVSAMPVDGTFPTGTAQFEKRSIAAEIPIWDPSICIDCGLCSFVCPHAAIRMKLRPSDAAPNGAPESFRDKDWSGKDFAGAKLTIQVAPDDCTGCGVCVDVCPARSKTVAKHKAINMESKWDHLDAERANFEYFLNIPEMPRDQVKADVVKATQLLQPLFEFSGACAGCGETPYLKLLTQLFGDRTMVANATGCSSIYGGNLPTTPWTTNKDGRGPAWANSLFEDNAEFGLGMRLAVEERQYLAIHLLGQLSEQLGEMLVQDVLNARCSNDQEIIEQRARIVTLRERLAKVDSPLARQLEPLVDALVPRSVWIVGGDGWAYDIGFGGLDHVLASGNNVNVLVLDTGVYSNTGGQASKATPRAAAAKFAADGKAARKKDLGMLAVSYGHVYVAQIAMGANPQQTIRAFLEAESYPGPSLLIAYSQCIAHGIDMTTGMTHQKDAVKSGFWPLYRYDPRQARQGGHPFQLDSRKPTIPLKDFVMKEARFAMLARSDAARAQMLLQKAQADINDQFHYYEQMGAIERELCDATAEEV